MTSASDRPARVVILDRDTISPETVLRPLSFRHQLEVFDINPIPATARHPAQPPPSTQVPTGDCFLPDVPAFRCKQCRNVRFAAWR